MIACFYISRFRRLTVAMGSARFHLASSLIQHNISTTLFLLFWPSWLIVLTRVFIRRQSYPIMNVPTKGDGEHIFHFTILVQYSMLLDALGIRYTHCTLSSNVRSKISRSLDTSVSNMITQRFSHGFQHLDLCIYTRAL